VRLYNRRVRSQLDEALEHGKWAEGESPSKLLNVAIEHRLMHVETLAYMLHQLPVDRKMRCQQPAAPAVGPVEMQMVDIPAGRATLGTHEETFGWDNEYKLQTVDVTAFCIDRYKVTNGQYLDFVHAGGYQDRGLWSDTDWNWKSEQGIEHPAFWSQTSGGFLLRTMFGETPLPLDWPVYVSYAEASAYARWSGKRLPTEPEWHRAAYGTPAGGERRFPWGEEAPSARHGHFDLRRWDGAPVHAFPCGRSAFGVEGMLANGWEWTSTRFEPFPGFQAFPFYPGYSANFFDGKHYVMKGGSPRTAECLLRRSFRNWFQPHYQYVYAGFRCVK
jgi:ergothioneine biosynthesis protein EgtB